MEHKIIFSFSANTEEEAVTEVLQIVIPEEQNDLHRVFEMQHVRLKEFPHCMCGNKG